MKEGDTVDVSQKAAGSFTLSHAPQSRDLWLIGTGTGLAPYIAMLRTEEVWQRYERIVVVNGVRYGRDLAYQEELEGYKKKHPDRFHSLSVVSRESHPGSLHGRITHVLANGLLEEAADLKLDPKISTLMLCGNPDMLDEMEAMLALKGLQKHRTKNLDTSSLNGIGRSIGCFCLLERHFHTRHLLTVPNDNQVIADGWNVPSGAVITGNFANSWN